MDPGSGQRFTWGLAKMVQCDTEMEPLEPGLSCVCGSVSTSVSTVEVEQEVT